ncbi:homoserine kinase [Enterococcus gallinarum]|uniref:homoserine kinase n=1 Tax=Enterococcus gallinarum TaxID=1353 RepID=UPI0022DFE7C6|nr:homoserine kinase [Enterococcus gallinarum]
MKIRVPATSANLGPGFDSCGIALSKYLFIEIMEESDRWEILHELGSEIPNDESNLLLRVALKLAPTLTPRKIRMYSDIPLARGLGSSSSVIVAGIELANRLGHLNLSDAQKVNIATAIEGHPDNVAPAIYGDFLITAFDHEHKQTYVVKHHFPECNIVAYIPQEQLLTEASRNVLPKTLDFSTAVEASAIANVMIAAVIKGNLPLAGKMMQADRFHENYREKLIPHLSTIRQICEEEGGYGCFLSGAGPTVLAIVPPEKADKICRLLHALETNAAIEQLQIDREGVQVF